MSAPLGRAPRLPTRRHEDPSPRSCDLPPCRQEGGTTGHHVGFVDRVAGDAPGEAAAAWQPVRSARALRWNLRSLRGSEASSLASRGRRGWGRGPDRPWQHGWGPGPLALTSPLSASVASPVKWAGRSR